MADDIQNKTTTDNGNSNEQVLPPVDAKVNITADPGAMTARIKVSPPENDGEHVNEDMIRTALEKNTIVKDINESIIEIITKDKIYNKEFIIARGNPATPGKNGELTYLVDLSFSLKPKEREDGTADYRELGFVNNVEKGQELVKKTPPEPGIDGYNVRGDVIRTPEPTDPALPAGTNTEISEDGLTLTASKTGHAEMAHGKVCVYDVFTINDDVSNSTGNIKFDGSVVVNGNVRAGFVVEATGDIIVRGTCEAAVINSDGSISVTEGIAGGQISAKDDIKSVYLQSCRVYAGGSIYTDAVINCELQCGGSLILEGRKSTIIGGSCSAYESIKALYAGAKTNRRILTRLEVGLNPEIINRLREAPKELEEVNKSIDSIDRVITLFSQLEAANRLDEEKKQNLEKARYTKTTQLNVRLALIDEIKELNEKMENTGHGEIIIKKGVAEGVKIVIGPYQMTLENSINGGARFTRGENDIEISPAF